MHVCVLLCRIISASLARSLLFTLLSKGMELCIAVVVDDDTVVCAGSFDAGFKLIIHCHDSPKSNYLLLTQKLEERERQPSLSFSCRDIVCPFSVLTSHANARSEWSGGEDRTRAGDGEEGERDYVVCIQSTKAAMVSSLVVVVRALACFLTAFRGFSRSSGLGIVALRLQRSSSTPPKRQPLLCGDAMLTVA